MDRFSLVKEAGSILGVFGLASGIEDIADPVKEYMTPLSLSDVISANTTYFQAIEILTESSGRPLLVVDGNRVTGTLCYASLFKPAGRLCLFCLTLELEELIVDLLAVLPSAQKHFEALNPTSQAVAKKHHQRRLKNQGRTPPPGDSPWCEWISCASFKDKLEMLKTSKRVALGNNQEEELFQYTEKIRNCCAHPSTPDELATIIPKTKLGEFVHGCQRVINAIANRPTVFSVPLL
jgi:hypothetical protein